MSYNTIKGHVLIYFRSLFVLLCLLNVCSVNAADVDYANCQNCHSQQHEQWRTSDHAHAMSKATNATVLGNFNNTHASHFAQQGLFFKENNTFKAKITEGGKSVVYDIEYTFGYSPLQQYLVQVASGRYQVLPFAWDTRDKAQGGQRWYHLYNEAILPNDRLHWLQPTHNWNGMCADCHSDGLIRNLDVANQTFDTQFQQINVGCLACHDGKQNPHKTSSPATSGYWRRAEGENIASWHGTPRDNDYEQTCFACHGLRTPITDGFNSQIPFLDQFTPGWIAPPFYYPDGQIKEEDFIYGSFKQSKMAQKGVTCIDCHDPHSGQLVASGNGVCLQCHAPETYDVNTHHRHQQGDVGSQCINCHMPKTTFMGIDARGDHSFKIPRPEFTLKYDVPNACNGCHNEQTANWALLQLDNWFPNRQGPTDAENAAIDIYSSLSVTTIKKVADNPQQPAIKRGNAIALLRQLPEFSGSVLKNYVTSSEPLIRLAAAQVSERLPEAEKRELLPPLLRDEYRAIRIAAVNALVGVLPSPQWQASYEKAFQELQTSLDVTSWRGEGLVMQGNLAVRTNNLSKAIMGYETSIVTDPYFSPAYLNLADLYRRYGNTLDEANTLSLGVERNPNDAPLHYAYALHFIREKAMSDALLHSRKAVQLDNTDPRNAYLYLLVLENIGQQQQAMSELDRLLETVSDPRQLKALKQKWLSQP